MDRAIIQGSQDCLAAEGEAGQVARSIDWRTTAIGAVPSWSEALRSSAAACLASRWPTTLFWGRELVCIYNDAYREIILQKHPAAMGRTARDVFPEIWEQIEPLLREASTSGAASRYADWLLAMKRRGFIEEAYFTFSLTPVKAPNGTTEGLVCAVHETTRRIIAERRFNTLRELLG